MGRGEGEHQPSPSARSSHQSGQIRAIKAQKSATLCAWVSATLPGPGTFCRHFNRKLLVLSLLPVPIARHGKNKYGVDQKKKKKKTQTFVILIGRQSHRALHRGTIVPLSIPPMLARSGQYSNTLSGVPGQPGKRWQSPHKCQPEHPQSEHGLQEIPEGFSLPLVADLQ